MSEVQTTDCQIKYQNLVYCWKLLESPNASIWVFPSRICQISKGQKLPPATGSHLSRLQVNNFFWQYRYFKHLTTFDKFYLNCKTPLLPPANEVWGMVMFLLPCVILFTGGLCMMSLLSSCLVPCSFGGRLCPPMDKDGPSWTETPLDRPLSCTVKSGWYASYWNAFSWFSILISYETPDGIQVFDQMRPIRSNLNRISLLVWKFWIGHKIRLCIACGDNLNTWNFCSCHVLSEKLTQYFSIKLVITLINLDYWQETETSETWFKFAAGLEAIYLT